MIDFIFELFKGFFDVVWTLITEVVVVIVKEFWFILLALLGVGLIWYLGGGYDRAEQAYQAQQKKADESAQVQQQLEQEKQKDPNAGVYIVN